MENGFYRLGPLDDKSESRFCINWANNDVGEICEKVF